MMPNVCQNGFVCLLIEVRKKDGSQYTPATIHTVADPDRFHGFHGTPPFTQEHTGDQLTKLATQLE